MIITAKANGDILNIKPSVFYQGSTEANKIYLIAPFAISSSVSVGFTLPNMTDIPVTLMTPSTAISDTLNTWSFDVGSPLTQYVGIVKVNISITTPSGTTITLNRCQFEVKRGDEVVPPDKPEADVYNTIVQALADIYANFINKVDTNYTENGISQSVINNSNGLKLVKTVGDVTVTFEVTENGVEIDGIDIKEQVLNAVTTANEANETAENAESVALGIDAKATEALSNSETAVITSNEAKAIALSIEQAKVFDTFEDMETWLKDEANKGLHTTGLELLIKSDDVPDYWVTAVLETPNASGYYYDIEATEATVLSVNNKKGIVVLKTDDISDENETNKWSTVGEKEKISKIVTDGDGSKALLNDGTYGEVGTVDTVNNVLPDENKNITITADDISDTSTTNKFVTAEDKFKWDGGFSYSSGAVFPGPVLGLYLNSYSGVANNVFVPEKSDIGDGLENVVCISSNAFEDKNIKIIELPQYIVWIGDNAFKDSELDTLIVNAINPPSLISTAFNGSGITASTGAIYVPYESLSAYKTADGWSTYADRIFAIPEGKWITEDITAIQANYVTTDTAQDITGEKTFESDVNIGEVATPKNLNIVGDLNIAGDIIQDGSTYETHAEQVYTTKDEIILRDGAVAGLATGALAKITAKLYDGTNDGVLGFDNNGIARVGDVGSEQALATREDTPTDTGFARWDSATNKFITETPDSTPINGSVKPITSNGVFRSTFNRVYRELTEISGVSGASSINDVCTAMNNSSYLFCSAAGYPNLIPSGTTDQNGTLEITRRFEYRTVLKYSWLGRMWHATWRQDLGFSGWKEVATKDNDNTWTGINKFVGESPKVIVQSTTDQYNVASPFKTLGFETWDKNGLYTGAFRTYRSGDGSTSVNMSARNPSNVIATVGLRGFTNGTWAFLQGDVPGVVDIGASNNRFKDCYFAGSVNAVDLNLTGNAKGILKPFTATLPYTSWTGNSAPYSKEVTVSGILATDKLDFEINFNGVYEDEQIARSNFGLVYKYVTSTDKITFYANAIPTADIPLTIKVVR